MINKSQEHKIKELLIRNNSIYANLEINNTLEHFVKRYIKPLQSSVDIKKANAIDCGCGYGWFSFAYILSGGKHITMVEPDVKRLAIVKDIASILGITTDSASFINSSIENLNYNENTFDIFVSIETLEHIGKSSIKKSLEKINFLTSNIILLTTPNKFFPMIAHDTRIPFLHWFPIKYRKLVTRFVKKNSEHNDFLSPFDISIFKNKFRCITSCLSFQSYNDYINQFPVYLPYGRNNKLRYLREPGIFKKVYYYIISRLCGTKSYYLMPSLSSIFKAIEVD